MTDRLLGAHLVLVCQRTDCEATEAIEILPPPTERVGDLMADFAPVWGWDTAGVNTVLHCPEHRG